MGTLGAFLAAAIGPLGKRLLIALGFGIVSYAAVATAVGSLLSQARTAWGGIGADTAAYIALAGGNQALAIIAGAIVARVGLQVVKRMQLL